MNAQHKKLVTAAAAAIKTLGAAKAKAEKLQASLDDANAEVTKAAAELSEIEHESASAGLAVHELHAAVKGEA